MILSGDMTDLQVFIELTLSPVLIKDDDHRIILVNELACELFRRSREILTVERFEDLFDPAKARIFHQADDRVFASGAIDETEEHLSGELTY